MVARIFSIFVIFVCLFIARTVFAQESSSLGAAPNQLFQTLNTTSDHLGSRAFVYQGAGFSFQLYVHSLGYLNLLPKGSPVGFGFPGASSINTINRKLYVNDLYSPYTMYTADTATGIRTTLFNCTNVPQPYLTGITWNIKDFKMYGVSTDLTVSQIFTIDLTTGVCTPIGNPTTICSGAISISANSSGTLFVICINSDALYKVNRITGNFSLVGSLGLNANYGQDAQFDLSDNKLYWASYTTGPYLRIVDTSIGTSTIVGSYSYQTETIGIYPGLFCCMGIADTKMDEDIKIFPNPAQDNITITIKGYETLAGLNLTIYNLEGQLLLQQTLTEQTMEINISKLPAGIYLAKLQLADGSYAQQKFVVAE